MGRKPEKVIRDGKVAVLYSPGFGAGWSSWSGGAVAHFMLYDKALVDWVESGGIDRMDSSETSEELEKIFVDAGYEVPYLGGAEQLTIEWLSEGVAFEVSEYDGSESVGSIADACWEVA